MSTIQGPILAYLQKNSNQPCYVKDMMVDLGLEVGQVKSGVYQIWSSNKADARSHLEIVIRGQQWVWHTGRIEQNGAKRSGRLFEELGTTKSGDIIVQDEDGNVGKVVFL